MNDLSTKKEFAEAAQDLLDNKAFKQAILELRKRWFDELMTGADTREQRDEMVAKMKALEAIPLELTILVNDYKMALSRQHKHG
jgi:hypothetical protein